MAKATRGERVFIAHYGSSECTEVDDASAFLSVHRSFKPAFRAVVEALWDSFPRVPPTRTADDRLDHDDESNAEFDDDFNTWEKACDKYINKDWLPSTSDGIRELLFDYTANDCFSLVTAEVDETSVDIQLLRNEADGGGGFKPVERISLRVTRETVGK